MAGYTISVVNTAQDLRDIVKLFELYAQSLGIDLSFQDFAGELDNLPGKYAPPTGALFVARSTPGEALGCVGLRALSPEGLCEMKRLYVEPKGRGSGAGHALARAAIDEARRLGYKAMRLDTLSSMVAARTLYESLGFSEIGPYYSTPLEDTVFLELRL